MFGIVKKTNKQSKTSNTSKSKETIQLSIIIPCYNEEDNIAECLARVPTMPWRYEILVVDDGSKDKTVQVARKKAKQLKDKAIRVISYQPNQGKGHAIQEGIKAAQGEFSIILDADMATMPEEIPKVVIPLFDGSADFVNGTRFIFSMDKNAMYALHKPGNKMFALLVSMIIRQRLTDSLCGFKAFRTKAFKGKLKENSWPDFELLIKAKRLKLRIAEVPIHYKERVAGVSKMKTFKHGYSMLKMLIKSTRSNY